MISKMLPPRQRQVIASMLESVLGSHWKVVRFRRIDQTALSTLSEHRIFEPELKLVPLFISKPGAVFDIGANVGEYTYVLEKAVGSRRTFAIEPVPQLTARLKRLFPQVRVLSVALSDGDGTRNLKIPIVDGKPLLTRSTLEEFSEPNETGGIFEHVQIQTLDALCESMNVADVAFMKIDVEGHELKVLQGASGVLTRCHPTLLVEIEQRHHSESISKLFSWIGEQEYSGFFYHAQQMLFLPIKDFSVNSHQRLEALGTARYINNFFFVHRNAAESVLQLVRPAIQNKTIH